MSNFIDSDDDAPLAALATKSSVTVKKRKAAYIDSDDDDVPLAKKAIISKSKTTSKTTVKKEKKAKSVTKKTVKSKKTTVKKEKTAGGTAGRKLKTLTKMETLEMAIKARRWWNDEPLPEGIAWKSLAHNGVLFPPPYKPLPSHVKLKYDGRIVELTPEQEEVAYFYASMPLDGPQLGNPKTAPVFNKNFFKDFKQALGKGHTIKDFGKLDFSAIRVHQELEREKKKEMTKEEKEPEKKKKEEELFKHGYAIVDGSLEKVGNFRIEPPGLFRGRGDHPKTGTLKQRVNPEEVTLNVGPDDVVPPCPVPGHSWKEVIHRDTVTWLAYWNENVMGGTKYVWLAASSSFKGKSDMEKYEKARLLKSYIEKIRANYTKGLKAKDKLVKQRSTAMWVIDILALRVGNEKGEDEADTVGCCSLRVEHMHIDSEAKTLRLSFLGKDSMRYDNTIDMSRYGDIGLLVLENLK